MDTVTTTLERYIVFAAGQEIGSYVDDTIAAYYAEQARRVRDGNKDAGPYPVIVIDSFTGRTVDV